MNDAAPANDEFTAFWNDVLVAKFERFRNILMEGLSYHSAQPFRTLDVPRGAKVLDVGCGWGDTAIELARMTGPSGSVLGLDCCNAFLEKGRRDAQAAGLANVTFVEADVQTYRFARGIRSLLLALRDDVLQQPRAPRCATSAPRSSLAVGSCSSHGGRSPTTRGSECRRTSC